MIQLWTSNEKHPENIIPIRITKREDNLWAESIESYGKKYSNNNPRSKPANSTNDNEVHSYIWFNNRLKPIAFYEVVHVYKFVFCNSYIYMCMNIYSMPPPGKSNLSCNRVSYIMGHLLSFVYTQGHIRLGTYFHLEIECLLDKNTLIEESVF